MMKRGRVINLLIFVVMVIAINQIMIGAGAVSDYSTKVKSNIDNSIRSGFKTIIDDSWKWVFETLGIPSPPPSPSMIF